METGWSVVSLASPLMAAQEEERILSRFLPAWKALGGQLESATSLPEKLTLFFVASGGTEQRILDQLNAYNPELGPPLLLAHAGDNSLPAALEAVARLHQQNRRGRIIYFPEPDDPQALEELQRLLLFLQVQRRLQRSKIGLLGQPSDWLVASQPDLDALQRSWGPSVLSLPWESLEEARQEIRPAEAREALESWLSQRRVQKTLPAESLESAASLALGLESLCRKNHLDAVTLPCFDLLYQDNLTGCLALAWCNEKGILAGCEGDLVSTLGMLWAHLLLKQLPWMANVVQVIPEEDSIKLAHCTVPAPLVRQLTLRTHFESGKGVGLEGAFAPGPATVFRLGGVHLQGIWLADGLILPTPHQENLCRTQVLVQLSSSRLCEDLLRRPLGNHLILLQGHHESLLRDWWDWFIDGGTV